MGEAKPALNCAREIRTRLNAAIRQSGLDRLEIARRMNDLVGAPITKPMLDAWTATSKAKWRFPLEYAAAFEEATGTHLLVEFLARQRGLTALSPSELRLYHLGCAVAAEETARRQREVLLAAIEVKLDGKTSRPPRQRVLGSGPRFGFWYDREVRVFLEDVYGTCTIKQTAEAVRARFGRARAPSKSAICRYWQRLDETADRPRAA